MSVSCWKTFWLEDLGLCPRIAWSVYFHTVCFLARWLLLTVLRGFHTGHVRCSLTLSVFVPAALVWFQTYLLPSIPGAFAFILHHIEHGEHNMTHRIFYLDIVLFYYVLLLLQCYNVQQDISPLHCPTVFLCHTWYSCVVESNDVVICWNTCVGYFSSWTSSDSSTSSHSLKSWHSSSTTDLTPPPSLGFGTVVLSHYECNIHISNE